MKRNAVLWIVGYFILVLAVLLPLAATTVQVDPFFHYHKPDTDTYYYKLDNQRSQNDGIIRNFDYTGLITGTSLTENFLASEAEALWGGTFIKVSFSGASFRELNENIAAALRRNPDLRVVIRGVESAKLIYDKDLMRDDMGDYPSYLYDENPLNDVEYLLNRDIMFDRIYPMIKETDEPDFTPGITSFDQYSNWSGMGYRYGVNALFPDGVQMTEATRIYPFNDIYEKRTRENVAQNLTDIADANPDVTFYYFFTPYSAKFWKEKVEIGTLERHVASEKLAIEEMLKRPNIRLYSFNCMFDLTMDLNNYKDTLHYGDWVNSMILRYMHEGKCLLTPENYEAYLEEELAFYSSYDYTQLAGQEDYENDLYAALKLAETTSTGAESVIDLRGSGVELRHAEIAEDQYKGSEGILCTGTLPVDYRDKGTVLSDYLRDTDYVGARIAIDDITPYRFLAFYGRKVAAHGQPTVYVYDAEGKAVAACRDSYRGITEEWTPYIINVAELSGPVTVVFNGGYIDNSGDPTSQYVFSRILLF